MRTLMIPLALLAVGMASGVIIGCADNSALDSACGQMRCPTGVACVAGRCEEPGTRPAADGGTTTVPLDGAVLGDGAFACGATTFRVTDTQESFAVPASVRYLIVKAWGAGGNGEGRDCPDNGGPGGFSAGIFSVTPGEPMVIIVGKRGRAGDPENRNRFGWGAHGGGGLTGVFRGEGPLTDADADRALIIAGGGGSAAPRTCSAGGPGNHTDAGGMSTMQGSFGYDRDGIIGGGGGRLGGDGGDLDAPGRGGTGFVHESAASPHILAANMGDVGPPAADDPDYDGVAGTTEQSGHLVLHFLCDEPGPLLY